MTPDPMLAPLSGVNLIEASAGTGKTYTITGLYLRLVLEQALDVEQILVVTFTKAATAELRGRLRERLISTLACLQGEAEGDEFERGLLQRLQSDQGVDHDELQRRLLAAIRGFDQASVFTIHGLCQRVLADRAMAADVDFDADMLEEPGELLQEVVDDYWRLMMAEADALWVDYLLGAKYSPDKLRTAISPYLGKPYLRVIGADASEDCQARNAAWQSALQRCQTLWQEDRQNIEALFRDKSLNARRYSKRNVPNWLAKLDAFLSKPSLQHEIFKSTFDYFLSETLADNTKDGHATVSHAFINACDALHEARERLVGCLKARERAMLADAIIRVDEELNRRRRERRELAFDDLLLNLHKAIKGPGGEALTAAVGKRYRAALIDEFQDTDPIQYDIFRSLFASGEHPLFLVGDPKQAIYSFRGADIYAYLAAGEDTQHRYSLRFNWRSDARLVQATNALFQLHPRPFLLDSIGFEPVQAGRMDASPLWIDGEDETAPLTIWPLWREDDSKPLGSGEAGRRAQQAVADEVARLLALARQDRARLGQRALRGGDIAILVRGHKGARDMAGALRERGIASVRMARESVYESEEAQALQDLLAALADPRDARLLRTALAGSLLDLSGPQLSALEADDVAWERHLSLFNELHGLWKAKGFMAMFQTLLRRFSIAPRLLELRDGERRLTNLLHLGELLQAHAEQGDIGQAALVQWLAGQRQAGEAAGDSALLRLESDEALVRIVTIHTSKGLQYPLVFCPDLWSDALRDAGSERLRFHDPKADFQATLDLGSPQQDMHRPQAMQESLAEQLRLAYVALTRAQHRCYVAWGNIDKAGQSALGWLWHGTDPVQSLHERFKDLSDTFLAERLQALCEISDNSIRVSEPEPYEASGIALAGSQTRCEARRFSRPLFSAYRVTSFSALTEDDAHAPVEQPDFDAQDKAPREEPEQPLEGIHAFARGAQAGQCLHDLLEHLDPKDLDEDEILLRNTDEMLQRYGFDTQWSETIVQMLRDVQQHELLPGLRLAEVPVAQRMAEMAFHYPLRRVDVEGLKAGLLANGYDRGPIGEQIANLSLKRITGYMKGFIDLVFRGNDGRWYVVDYKSNWLGTQCSDYHAQAIEQSMAEHQYHLQYLIYSLALNRYLRLRIPDYDPEQHWGGALYLFLRGMGEAGFGVYYDRPSQAVLQVLEDCLAG